MRARPKKEARGRSNSIISHARLAHAFGKMHLLSAPRPSVYFPIKLTSLKHTSRTNTFLLATIHVLILVEFNSVPSHNFKYRFFLPRGSSHGPSCPALQIEARTARSPLECFAHVM